LGTSLDLLLLLWKARFPFVAEVTKEGYYGESYKLETSHEVLEGVLEATAKRETKSVGMDTPYLLTGNGVLRLYLMSSVIFSSSSSSDDNEAPSFPEFYDELSDSEEQPNERTPSPPPRKKSLSPLQAPSKSIYNKSIRYASSSSPNYCFEDQYAVSIKENMAYPYLHSPKTTKEKRSIRRIQRRPIRRIGNME
ncbi:hypothetical protein Tco_0014979, partial [Tanacetum coccineum]